MMNKNEFYVGLCFYMAGSKYRVTDIGQRVVIAIKLQLRFEATKYNPSRGEHVAYYKEVGESYYSGHPSCYIEFVINEYDMHTCSLTKEEPETNYKAANQDDIKSI